MAVAHQVVPDIRHVALLEGKCPATMCPAGHHVTAAVMVAVKMALHELRIALMKVAALQAKTRHTRKFISLTARPFT